MMGLAFALAFFSAVFELSIAYKWDWWRKKAAHSLLVSAIGSIGLSFVLGTMFGAHGLISMIGGMMSTGMVLVGYPVLEWYIQNQARFKEGVEKAKAAIISSKQTLIDFAMFFWRIIRLLTWPFRAKRAVQAKFSQISNHINTREGVI